MPCCSATLRHVPSHRRKIWDDGWPVHENQRRAIDLDVSRISKEGKEIVQETRRIVGQVLLLNQNLLLRPVPPARPVLIRPAHAERKVDRRVREHEIQRALEEPAAGEPVVVVAKAVDAVLPGELDLTRSDFRHAEIVVAELSRPARLRVAFVHRPCPSHVGPLGEPRSPPIVILRNRVELRQVERDQSDVAGHC